MILVHDNLHFIVSIYKEQLQRTMPNRKISENHTKRIEEIGLLIKNWRISEGLSQQEFCYLADIHINTLHNLEDYKKNVSVLTILNCIDAIGLSVSDFFKEIE